MGAHVELLLLGQAPTTVELRREFLDGLATLAKVLENFFVDPLGVLLFVLLEVVLKDLEEVLPRGVVRLDDLAVLAFLELSVSVAHLPGRPFQAVPEGNNHSVLVIVALKELPVVAGGDVLVKTPPAADVPARWDLVRGVVHVEVTPGDAVSVVITRHCDGGSLR